MLVLSRKAGQSIAIGDDVRVVIVAVDGDHVTVGVEAPRELPVHRATKFSAAVKRKPANPKRNPSASREPDQRVPASNCLA